MMMLIILFGFISFGKFFYYRSIVAKIGHNLICKNASIQSPNFYVMLSVKYQIHDDNSKRVTIQIKKWMLDQSDNNVVQSSNAKCFSEFDINKKFQ